MKNKKKVIGIRVDENFYEELKEAADKIGLNVSNLVRMVMKEYIDNKLKGVENENCRD